MFPFKKRVTMLIWNRLPRKRSGKILQVLGIVTSEIVISERQEFECSLLVNSHFLLLSKMNIYHFKILPPVSISSVNPMRFWGGRRGKHAF